ncbi:hypothetical protein ACEYW6_06420 [Nostoc sp. UIC 10607]|uniref:hypothetical protein n=1 Tax=Nostoc sp. UIC 10607 TaxID=3045935 RepID=UPI0039A1DBEE
MLSDFYALIANAELTYGKDKYLEKFEDMVEVFHFTGFIKRVTYKTYLDDNLSRISLDVFDINKERGYGLIKSPTTEIAYSKWIYQWSLKMIYEQELDKI